MMVQRKLIIYIKGEKTFEITDYGMHTLKLYDDMVKLLIYNPGSSK
jgi:hypothetical protein